MFLSVLFFHMTSNSVETSAWEEQDVSDFVSHQAPSVFLNGRLRRAVAAACFKSVACSEQSGGWCVLCEPNGA